MFHLVRPSSIVSISCVHVTFCWAITVEAQIAAAAAVDSRSGCCAPYVKQAQFVLKRVVSCSGGPCWCVCVWQVKEQKEEAERFQQKLKEMEDLKIESFLVQLFHINKVYSLQSSRIDRPIDEYSIRSEH